MCPSSVRKVAVIGTGTIGSSWIALFLSKGLNVVVTDPDPIAASKLSEYLKVTWPVLERFGLAPGASASSYEFVEEIDDHLGDVDFIQENGPERLEFKRKLIARLDRKAPSNVVICSSSSGIPSSQFILHCTCQPGRVLIGHPFNPPHIVPLVEVVPHPRTETRHVTAAMEFYRSLGRTPVLVMEECPGFVGNRLQGALLCEAYSLVARGVVSANDLDLVVTSALGLRWALTGPLTTNTLAAGGSFRRIMEHLGPSVLQWRQDMDKKRFDFQPSDIHTLTRKVEELEEKLDVYELLAKRDKALLELLKVKAETGLN